MAAQQNHYILGALLITGCILTVAHAGVHHGSVRQSQISRTAHSAYAQLPLCFEANRGQTDAHVKFFARGAGYGLFLTDQGAIFSLHTPSQLKLIGEQSCASNRAEHAGSEVYPSPSAPSNATTVRMFLAGANSKPNMTGAKKLRRMINYFIGNDPLKWRTNIPCFAEVHYEEVYPGIDLICYGNQQKLEYDFVVTPGADPKRIALTYSGAERLTLDSQGDLVLKTSGGELRQRKPTIYQEFDGVRREIPCGYLLQGDNRVTFRISDYDEHRPLIIDPVLAYSTFVGGKDSDYGLSVATDNSGNSYITGYTMSLSHFPPIQGDFPNSRPFEGAFDPTANNKADAFVIKIDPDNGDTTPRVPGDSGDLLYSTFLGGKDNDIGQSITVDTASPANVYVTGTTESADFPISAPAGGAFDARYNGNGDGFIVKLNPDPTLTPGSPLPANQDPRDLLYSTFIGGTSGDNATSIALDSANPPNVYVTGTTSSPNFPISKPNRLPEVGALQARKVGNFDAFVVKLKPDPLDASPPDIPGDINSPDDPTDLVYSTYLGGPYGNTSGTGIAVDTENPPNIYITGITDSNLFPTKGALPRQSSRLPDAFVTKLKPDPRDNTPQPDRIAADPNDLLYSTYLGGDSHDAGFAIDVDADGHAYITGATLSNNFPRIGGPFDLTYNQGGDVFFTELNTNMAGIASLVYSTYLGGKGYDAGSGIDVEGRASDETRRVYITGITSSRDDPFTPADEGFPTTLNAFQINNKGNTDAFVVVIRPDPDVPPGALQDPNDPDDLFYSTYLGNSGDDSGSDISVHLGAFGLPFIYVVGTTRSSTSAFFPTTGGAFDPTYNGNTDAFLAFFSDVLD